MILLVVVALIILICSLIIHYRQHFRVEIKKCWQKKINPLDQIKVNSNSPLSDTPSPTDTAIVHAQMKLFVNRKRKRNRSKYCCSLVPNGDDEFDFVPMSFLFYLLFMILLCILIICLEIANYCYYHNHETMIDLLFGYSVESYHNNSLFEIHRINSRIKAKELSIIYIMDYILIYGIMILSVWESLFSFYRYYSTSMATQKFQNVTTKQILIRYPIYAIIFCIMFLTQIHLYYWTFPIIITFFCVFNCYCTYKFASMLTERYKTFIEIQDKGVLATANQDILHSVILMGNTSLICGILQTVYLSALIITYNVNIVFYLPILWSMAGFLMTINFVRNRRFIKRKLFKYQQFCKYICCDKVAGNVDVHSSPKRVNTLKTEIQIVLSPSDSNHNKKEIDTKTNNNNNDNDDENQYHQFNDIKHWKKPNLHQQTQSVNIYEISRTHKIKRKRNHSLCDIIDIEQKDETPFSIKPTLSDIRSHPVISYKKIQQKSNNNNDEIMTKDDTAINIPSFKHNTSSNKRVAFKLFENKTDDVSLDNIDTMDLEQDAMNLEQDTMKRTSSMRKNKALEVLGIESSTPNTPNSTINIEKKPTFFNNMSRSKSYQNSNDEQKVSESPLELPILSPPLDQVPTMSLHESWKISGGHNMKSSMSPKPKLKHTASNSAPILMDDLFISLNVWAKSGFCLQKNINSAKQLNEYQNIFKNQQQQRKRKRSQTIK